MTDRFEPDKQFVDRLEWQLASEFRRRDRLKAAPGRIAVRRSVVAFSLAAGVFLLGVAATKAADLLKDSWRKKIEIARLETEIKIKRAFLELKREKAAEVENRFSLGLIGEEEVLDSKLGAELFAANLERSLLDLEEVRDSGEAPRDELYAPLVGGRDFVSERLEVERKALRLDTELRRARFERPLRQRVDLGLIPKSELDGHMAWSEAQEARIGELETRLSLRQRFLAGEISAEELEIQASLTEAERKLTEARSTAEAMKALLDGLQAKRAAGLISEEELRGAQMGLEAAQARESLALQEIEILKQIK
jgi:hypothetical protein